MTDSTQPESRIARVVGLVSFIAPLAILYPILPDGLPFSERHPLFAILGPLSSNTLLMIGTAAVALSSLLLYLTTLTLLRLLDRSSPPTSASAHSKIENRKSKIPTAFIAALTLPSLPAVRAAVVDAEPLILLLPLAIAALWCTVMWYAESVDDGPADDATDVDEKTEGGGGRRVAFLVLAILLGIVATFFEPLALPLPLGILLLGWIAQFGRESDPTLRPRSVALASAVGVGLLVIFYAFGAIVAPDDTRPLYPTDISALEASAPDGIDDELLLAGTYPSDDLGMQTRVGGRFVRTILRNTVGRIGDDPYSPSLLYDVTDEERARYLEPEQSDSPYPLRFFALPLLLALVGLVHHVRRDWPTGLAFALLFVAGPIAALHLPASALLNEATFILPLVLVAVWVGLGAEGLAEGLVGVTERSKNQKGDATLSADEDLDSDAPTASPGPGRTDPASAENIRRGAIVLALLLGPVNLLYNGWGAHDRSGVRVAEDFVYNMMVDLPEGAILFVEERETADLARQVRRNEGVGKGTSVVALEGLGDPDYRATFFRGMFGLDAPEPGIVEPTSFPLLFGTDTLDWTPTGQPRDSGLTFLSEELIWMCRAVLRNYERHPIYFSLTVRPDWYAGLDRWFVWSGLHYRLDPTAAGIAAKGYADYPVDTAGMRGALGEGGSLRLAGLSDRSIMLRPIERRRIRAYRRAFLSWTAASGSSGGDDILARMDRLLPIDAHPITYWNAAATALLAERVGADEIAEKYARRAIARVDALGDAWQDDPVGRTYNPHQIAASMLALLGDYDEAIARYRALSPNAETDPVIRGLIEELRVERHLSTGDTAAAIRELDAIIEGYGGVTTGGLGVNRGAWESMRGELGGG